jgi:hypothetical protein
MKMSRDDPLERCILEPYPRAGLYGKATGMTSGALAHIAGNESDSLALRIEAILAVETPESDAPYVTLTTCPGPVE